MTPTVSPAFLQQAHRNNWQRYLDSLRPDARLGWDLCVLTAGDERQAEMYRKQLDWRGEAGLLPAGTEFVVLADPAGRRIGSGGATLRALGHKTARHPYPAARRTLVIHSGGDSKRLPHCSALGKLFARIPRTLPDGRAATVFDEFLISLSGMAAVLPPGALIAAGDVLLVFDHLQLSFRRRGVTGVAASAPAEMAARHGVFVPDDGTHRLRAYLHKPGPAELARWRAAEPGSAGEPRVLIDTGLVWLDGETARLFTELGRDGAVQDAPLNLYGDLLLPLAESTERTAYEADESDGAPTPAVRAARRALWPRLRGIPLTVERLQPAVFVHFGTSREYYEMAAANPNLAMLCGWEPRAASWPAISNGLPLVLIDAALEGPLTPPHLPSAGPLLVTDSLLRGAVSWDGAGLIAGVRTAGPVHLRDGMVLDQAPLRCSGTVTRVYGLRDDPKRAIDDPLATFCSRPWPEWLIAAGVSAEAIWPAGSGERSLWEARLFPVARDAAPDREGPIRERREDEGRAGLELALWLQAPELAPPGWREAWLAAERVSLAHSAREADGERLLAGLMALEDHVAARRFCAGVLAEQPAAGLKACLCTTPAIAPRRVEAAAALLHEEPWMVRLRGLAALTEATGDASWEDRAFALLAERIEAATLLPAAQRDARPVPPPGARAGGCGETVRVEAAARIDFGGGWTDTPPHSIERGGTVLNAAVTLRGARPIVAEAQRLDEPRLILESRDIDAHAEPTTLGEVLNCANPLDIFALHKAALVLRGLVPEGDPAAPLAEVLGHAGGIRLTTATNIPMGSGLGVSSILAGAVLEALGGIAVASSFGAAGDASASTALPAEEAGGVAGSTADGGLGRLFDEVLCLEQMLTTGGGWQDQVGGLTGGIKLVTSEAGLPQRVTVAPVELSEATRTGLDERLVLVYTGQQRLAKNLLRNVMRRWMARDPEMVWIQGEIARLALAMRETLLNGDIDRFGTLLGQHWSLNKRIDPGCTNPFIDDMFETMRPLIRGGKLAGAGGGGFGFVVLNNGMDPAELHAALLERYPDTRVGVWDSAIPERGMVRGAGAAD